MRLLRPTWFEIDLDAAVDNLRAVRRLVGPGRKIVAVVKADAYGFGSLEMGRAFAAHGADALGVADLADGVRLRDAGLTLPILMYPNALPEAADDAIGADLIPTLTDLDSARARLPLDLPQRRRSRPHALWIRPRGRRRPGRAAPDVPRVQESARRSEGSDSARALRGRGAVPNHGRHAAGRDPGRDGRWRSSAERGRGARAGPARADPRSSVARAHASRPHPGARRGGRRRGGAGWPPGRRGDHARRDRGAPHHRSARAGAGRRAARGSRLRWKRRGRPSRRRQPHGGRRLMRNRLLAGLDRLRQANERLGRFMNAAAGWLFVVCSLFVSFDVLARKFFNVSSRATVELTGYMLAFGIAWGLCDALTTRAHIRVDVLVTKMPLRLRAFMHALALAFLALLAFFFVL